MKFILTVVIGAAALVALTVALFWRSLLTPEQKLNYGLVFSATEDFSKRAASKHATESTLADYVDALTREGNLGRAAYLADLNGVENTLLKDLRMVVMRSAQAAAKREVYDLSKDETVQAVQELPVRQALRFLQGYQNALLGDWASAKNYFSAIDEKQLAPVLRPYYRYYLGRCYRKKGDPKTEKPKTAQLFNSVIKAHADPELEARARYNLIALYLSEDYPGKDGLALAKDQQLSLSLGQSSWAKQKALTEFGEYYFNAQQLKDAWRLAEEALLNGPEQAPGEGAAELCLKILDAALQPGSSLLDGQGGLLLPLAAEAPLALAKAGAKHGMAVRTAKLLATLKPHIPDRARWQELYAGMALCYAQEADLPALQQVLAQANLQNFSDDVLARMYFDYAALLAARQQWNQALGYYRSSAKLGGPGPEQGGAGEALYQCYAILKHVQNPLDQQAAVGLLAEIVQQHEDSTAYAKAVEELLPLLIYQGSTEAARRLLKRTLELQPAAAGGAQAQREADLLHVLAQYWSDYLDDKAGRPAAGGAGRTCRYWSYYELAAGATLDLGAAGAPQAAAGQPERAAEYFAGLGLDGFDDENGDSASTLDPVTGYLELAIAGELKPLATRQWEATELLESGQVQDPALLKFVLDQAYPRPYSAEVAAAAKRFNVPPALIYAVIKKESSFKEDAQSGVGAQGLMQLMPPTAQWLTGLYSLPADYYARRREPAVNIMLGTAYVASLYDGLGLSPGQGGDNAVRQVLHCYNGGPANYEHWRGLYPAASGALLTELIPNEENEIFAKKVWKYYKIYSELE